MRPSLLSILLLGLAVLAAPAWGSGAARYALVIGNASYGGISPDKQKGEIMLRKGCSMDFQWGCDRSREIGISR